jgi:hypothetical protein
MDQAFNCVNLYKVASGAKQLSGRGGVPLQLGLQGLDSAELLRIPKPRHEIDPKASAVQLQVRVKQMRFNNRFSVAERRSWTKVEHSVMWSHRRLYANGVHAFRRKEFSWSRNRDVCGGKAQLTPSSSPFDDQASERVVATKPPKCAIEISARHCSPDRCRGDGLAALDCHRRNDSDLEAAIRS